MASKTRTPKAKSPKAKAAKVPARRQSRRAAESATPVRRQSGASRALGIASVGALAIAIGAALVEGIRRLTARGNAEHPAPDLALDQPHPGPDHRAPVDFRPDPTAAVPASEREGLRPATHKPSMVANDARDFALAD